MYWRSKSREIIYRVARTREELRQAFSLVYQEYLSRGYIPKHYKSRLRLSLYNVLPTTTTFVALHANKVVATVTLIPDSPLGIAMDKIYKEEIDGLRRKGRRVAEVSQLAIDSKLFPTGWFSMFNFDKLIFLFRLFKIVLDYGLYIEKLNDFCIAINPKHQYLYKFLGFEELGGLKYYGSVNKALAIAKRLNLDNIEDKAKHRIGLYKIFFGKKIDAGVFENKLQFSISDLEYFFTKKSDILKKATKEQLYYIMHCYPKRKINRLREKI